MSPSRPFILRPVATSLLMTGILLVGIVAYRQLPVSALPEVDYPTIQVADVLSGRQPGCDGLVGHGAAGAAVRPGAGPEPDDFHQFRGKLADHAAIFAGFEHRRGRAGGAGGDQRGDHLSAGRPAQSADLQQGQSRRHADPDAGADFATRCRCTRWRTWPTRGWRRKFRNCRAWGWSASAAGKSRPCAFRPIRPRCRRWV